MASKKKSQTVRLKEEILRALGRYCDQEGRTQQQVVSVGAWLFMSMPPVLQTGLNSAFFEWCKAESDLAYVPRGAEEFVMRVIAAIERECAGVGQTFAIRPSPQSEVAKVQKTGWLGTESGRKEFQDVVEQGSGGFEGGNLKPGGLMRPVESPEEKETPQTAKKRRNK